MPKPSVLTSPEAFARLKEGFDILGNLLSLTLGPTGGVVLSDTEYKDAPELLTGAAVIARRMMELPDQSQNVGAMLVRNLVWRVHQRMGDGSAITAVLACSLLDHTSRYVIAGANPVFVQKGIKRGVKATVKALEEMSQPIKGEGDLVAIAQAVTMQADLSLILGEMFDLLGEHAHITVEKFMAPYLERTYLNGGQWKAGLISPYLITATATRTAILEDAWVVIYDGDISNAADLGPMFDLVQRESQKAQKPFHLFIIAKNIKGDAMNALVSAHVKGKKQKTAGFQAIGVEIKRAGENLRADLEDLAILTGAEVISPNWGCQLTGIQAKDLGQVRRVEASAEELLIIDGKGNPAALRSHIQDLQKRLQAENLVGDVNSKPGENPGAELGMRLARLSGSTAVLKVGAASKAEREVLFQKAEQGIKAIKAALMEGVVPGGGVAYTNCIEAVESLEADHKEEKMGIQAVANCLSAPFFTILGNAEVDTSGIILEDLRSGEFGLVYDVLEKKIIQARDAGLLDSTKVLRVALETAASGAMLALSTGVVVLKRKPEFSYEP